MSPIAILLLCLFIDLVGFGIILPILPFIVQTYGGGPLAGGLLFAIYSAFAAAAGPFWGRLSDRIGRRRALMLTLLGAAVSYAVLGLADSLLMVFVARALSGAMAGNVGVVMAAMADLTTAKQRTRAMGLVGVSFGLGFATGPGVAAFLAAVAGADALALSGFCAAALSLSAFVLAWKRLPESYPQEPVQEDTGRPQRPGFRPFVDTPAKAGLLLQFVISSGAQSLVFAMSGFWASATMGWGEREVGLMMVTVGLVVAALQGFLVGPLAERFGEVRTYLGGLAANLCGALGVIFLADSVFAALVAFPLMLGGMTLAFPVLNSLVSQRSEARVQGTALGLAGGASAVGRVIGPTLGGLLMSSFGPTAPFLAVLALGVCGVSWVALEIRAERRRPRQSAPSTGPPTPQGP